MTFGRPSQSLLKPARSKAEADLDRAVSRRENRVDYTIHVRFILPRINRIERQYSLSFFRRPIGNGSNSRLPSLFNKQNKHVQKYLEPCGHEAVT